MIDREVPSTRLESPITSVASVIQDFKPVLRFVDSSGYAFVLRDGKAECVGIITKEGFRKLNDAEGHGPKELKW